ncbi:TonB-dependent receptor [Granulicella arctica]|uniref:TonB-dependent receptor n=1 Tax=Granulicella arctica TaxID=940613 RepID=UPI0021E06772|nr:carboxypeptidase regulatory-like domain-containing protein [Granulicella arctica]
MTNLAAKLSLFVILIFGIDAIGLAQVQSTTGSIQGEVMDAGGAFVVGASVETDEIETHTLHQATTDGSGHFDFLSLQPGRYTVKISKTGFATTIQENLTLTVGRTASLKLTLQVAGTSESVIVTSAPLVDVVTASSTTTLNEQTIATTPVLGRKFEDLLTLTPGVSISQGPDGDEININGQRGIFNNISLDGGDYNNGFFGEQSGGQRAAVDITLEAVKEFQVVASGANAEFGRTGGGVVNVITKSGTNDFHGSLFEYQRLEALAAAASDGTSLTDFHREQFGGSAGGHIIRDKLFYFGAAEGIDENLQRTNLSAYNSAALGGATPCSVTNPVFRSNITEAQINANGDCQRQVLLNFYKSSFNENEGLPVDHVVHNGAFFGRVDYTISPKNQLNVSYNFDYSNNANQTFDVSTYGTSANGTEGPSHVQTLNSNLITTLNSHALNEAHFTFGHETRPRSPIDPTAVPDTGIGFSPSFRFGQPFFLGPGSSETFYHLDFKDNYSLILGKHTVKVGAEYLYSHNVQVFDGFALGRYIFGSATGFLHYASPASTGNGYGPNTVSCADGSFQSAATSCPGGSANSFGSPLFLYLQDTATQPGETVQQAGYSSIANHEPALYAQDTWQVASRLTINYGLRWEAQFFPNPVIDPSKTAYGSNLSDQRFPSTGYLPNQTKEFQPRVGFAYDAFGNGKSALRGSAGIFNARQNGLTQVGAITTNGVQQQTIGTCSNGMPVYPNDCAVPATYSPIGAGVTVFDKNYHNPRILTFNVGYDQQVAQDYVAFVDFTDSKGVYLTRFTNPNVGPTVIPAVNADTVSYAGAVPFTNLGTITNTISNAKSLYRGLTIGMRKRMSHHFQFEAQYTYSVDRDDDSNERDPFTFRYANLYNLGAEYSLADRDERHKFNAFGLGELPFGFKGNIRVQQHSAEPETDNTNGTGTGAACSFNNSLTRFVNGVDCGRNHLRKDNAFFVFDFGVARPIRFHDSKFELIPRVEVFNTFNNTNNLNPLSSPALFDFSGFLRTGVGDPRQAQLSLRFVF